MECPHCGSELEHIDNFGFFNSLSFGSFIKSGDIYKCPNSNEVEDDRELCQSECFGGYFHIRENNSELQEGYPC